MDPDTKCPETRIDITKIPEEAQYFEIGSLKDGVEIKSRAV